MTALVLLMCAACSGGKPQPRPPALPWPRPEPVLSRYETATGRVIVRDCGYSVALPGKARQSLWLFCDTLVTSRQGAEIGGPILGTGSAAEGPYRADQAPTSLTEVKTPGAAPGAAPPADATARGAPEPFLGAPAGVTFPASNLPCAGGLDYPARWITGVAREPASSGHPGHVLISYNDYCVSGSSQFTPEAFGLLDYDPAGNVLGPPAQVFQAAPGQQLTPQWQLGSPVFAGGYLYLYRSCALGQGCGNPGVYLVRTLASPTWWQNGFAYQYWTGISWSVSPARAAPLSSHPATLEVSTGDFSAEGHGLVMIEQTSLAGDFTVWQATAPPGPWHRIETGTVPCSTGRLHSPSGLCRALIGHPELSTRGELLISFFDPGTNHVEVIGYPW
jgi:hypothetical protein